MVEKKMDHIKKILVGLSKEVPGLGKVISEYESEQLQEFEKMYQKGNLDTLQDLVLAVNNLNKDTGRKILVDEMKVTKFPIKKRTIERNGSTSYFSTGVKENECIEVVEDENSKYCTAFFVYFIFNNDERNTTIYDVELNTITDEGVYRTVLDQVKINQEDWKKCSSDDLTIQVDKNSTKKLFFRFLSEKYYNDDVSAITSELKIKHTSGKHEIHFISDRVEYDSLPSWTSGSSKGAWSIANTPRLR